MKPILVLLLPLMATPALAAPPPKPLTSTDPAKCEWIWKEGGQLGVWTEKCAMNGVWEPMFDATLPGFVITIDGEAGDAILQRFAKPVEGDVSAILPELRRRGFIPDDGDCVFETAEFPAPRPETAVFEIKPTGARKGAFDATPEDEIPEPPCGDYGWSTHGVRYFMTDTRHPDAVVYINTGQDGMMFDPGTVTIE